VLLNQSAVSDRNLALDGLRGLAVLMVLWSHATDLGIPKTFVLNLEGGGRYGVYLFFVLSSFLLSHQIITAPSSRLVRASYWLNYSVRRFFRIFPAFAVALVCYVLWSNGLPAAFPTTWPVAWEVLTLRQEWAVFWTIAVEFKYYFLLPLFALLFRSLIARPRLALSAFVGLSASISILRPPETGVVVWSYIPIFLCGTYAALIAVQLDGLETNRATAFFRQALLPRLGYAAIAFVVVLLPAIGRQFDPTMRLDTYHLWYLPFGLAFAVLVLAALDSDGWLRRLFSSSGLVLLGRISFSMYLIHMLIMGHVIEHFATLWVRVAIYAAATFAAGVIGYVLVERPFARLTVGRPRGGRAGEQAARQQANAAQPPL
jgi:peptidoglycan/LPS O-acetylase OafA/YrhL